MADEETGEYFGRPVDVVQYLDGSLLVSDDTAGAIYRITYKGMDEGMKGMDKGMKGME